MPSRSQKKSKKPKQNRSGEEPAEDIGNALRGHPRVRPSGMRVSVLPMATGVSVDIGKVELIMSISESVKGRIDSVNY